MSKYSLRMIFDNSILQEFQNSFSDFTGVSAVITDREGKQITHSSNFSRVCHDVINTSPENVMECSKCSLAGCKKSLENGKPYIYKCRFGMYESSIPILLGDVIVGCFICGQVLCTDEDEKALRQILVDMGENQQELDEIMGGITKMPLKEFERIVGYANKIAGIISEIVHKNYILIKSNRLRLSYSYVNAEDSVLDFGNDTIYNTHAMTGTVMAGIRTICTEQNITPQIEFLSEVPSELLGNPKTIQYVIEGIFSFIMSQCKLKNLIIRFSCIRKYYLYSLVMELVTDVEDNQDKLLESMNACFGDNPLMKNIGSSKINKALYGELNGSIDFNITDNNRFTARLTLPQLDVRGDNYAK